MAIRSIGSFLDYWRTIRGRTRRVVACIPPDRIEWSPHPGKFTFGDLVRHLAAIERYMCAETVAGRPSRYAGCGRHLAEGFEAVVAFLDRLGVESQAIFGTLTVAGHGRARSPPPWPDLLDARPSERPHAPALWHDLGRSPSEVCLTSACRAHRSRRPDDRSGHARAGI